MSDFLYQTGPKPEFERGHSPIDDVRVRVLVGFATSLIVFIVLVCVGLAAFNEFIVRRARATRAERPALLNIESGQYTGPELQDNPARDLPDRARHDLSRLDEYGWVEPGKIAHIPIDRAMAIIAERGLPGPKAAPGETITPDDAVRRARENRSQTQPE